ncbi:Bifunctional epoxide hydrolase [Lachnellula suecica]|uniref:Bifunctional epoxide hydrolase n=1 Tax=Lachnellula suecica TaxID=602035 RepID=A0A8T9CB47_9HELO|nr:Bifunctional epoxide hydrolase [Lachnellula suecica]
MAADIAELLSHGGAGRVVGVGHDWGAFLLSRLANYYPSLVSKLMFLDTGYTAPGTSLSFSNIKLIDFMVQQQLKYAVFGYFLFFDEHGAAALMNPNVESVESLFHSRDEEVIRGIWAPKMGFGRGWRADQAEFRKQAQLHNINAADEADRNKEIKQPTLLITTQNPISVSADFPAQMKPYMRNLEVVSGVEAGHWAMLEAPDETNGILQRFLDRDS